MRQGRVDGFTSVVEDFSGISAFIGEGAGTTKFSTDSRVGSMTGAVLGKGLDGGHARVGSLSASELCSIGCKWCGVMDGDDSPNGVAERNMTVLPECVSSVVVGP